MPNGKNATNFFPYLILFIEGKIWISLFFFKRSKFFRSIIGIYLPLVNDRYEGIQHTLKSTYTSWYNFVVFNFREYELFRELSWIPMRIDACVCALSVHVPGVVGPPLTANLSPSFPGIATTRHSQFLNDIFECIRPLLFFLRDYSLTSKWAMETTLSRSIVAVADKRLKRVNDWSDT